MEHSRINLWKFLTVEIAGSARSTASASHRIIVLPAPVYMGIVKVEPYPLLVALICNLSQDIPFERGSINGVVRAGLGMENGKSIMVPGSNAYIFCSRQFYCLHPLVGIEVHRIEPSCQFLILLVIDLLVVHYPLTVTQH